MSCRRLTRSLAVVALALTGFFTGCTNPVEVLVCETDGSGLTQITQLRVIYYRNVPAPGAGGMSTVWKQESKVVAYNAGDAKAAGGSPVAIQLGDFETPDKDHPMRLEWLNSKDAVLMTEELISLSALSKRTEKRDGKDVEVYLLTPRFCPVETAASKPTDAPPPVQAAVLDTAQALRLSSVSKSSTSLLVNTTADSALMGRVLNKHLETGLPSDSAAILHSAWNQQFRDIGTRFRFKSQNGKELTGTGFSGPDTNQVAFQFAPSVPDDMFVGNQCAGRIEWLFTWPDGKREVLFHSQDFVLAEKPSTATVLRLNAVATQNISMQPKTLTVSAAYKDGADGLYARLRQSFGALPEERGRLSYGDIDRRWLEAGGTIDTYFQPGTLREDDPNNPRRTDIGARQQGVATATDRVALTVPWPSLELIKKFVNPQGFQEAVTGYLVRDYRHNDKLVVVLLSQQIPTGVKLVESVVSSGGRSGGTVAAPAAPAAPTIASITPNSGVGGTPITITGANFRSGATVRVGGEAATGVNVASASSITATVPAGLAAGTHNIVVTNADSTTVTSAGAYTVPAPPTITAITPNNGLAGSSMTITGTNFRAARTVTIGGVAATVTGTSGTTSITVTVPAGLGATAQNVTVTNTDTTTVTSVGGYTVTGALPLPAPTIDVGGITPDGTMVGPWVQGQPFTITGTNFRDGATVTLGGTVIAGITVTPTQIDGMVPVGVASGNHTLVVTNTDNNTSATYGSTVFVP